MKTRVALSLLLAAWAGAAPIAQAPEVPEDLGARIIDVSDYPAEHQKTYHDIFLRVYGFIKGGPTRAINSPLIEIDPKGEEVLRRDHPELFADPRLAQIAPDAWRREVMRVKNRPPCCGACPVLSMDEARALWRFFAYDSLRRKTGVRAEAWAGYRRELIERFETTKRRPS